MYTLGSYGDGLTGGYGCLGRDSKERQGEGRERSEASVATADGYGGCWSSVGVFPLVRLSVCLSVCLPVCVCFVCVWMGVGR